MDATVQIKNYFKEWIDNITVIGIELKADFKDLIDNSNRLFLLFNYALTLEGTYYVENICYIHGMQDSDILFGHGNDDDYIDYYLTLTTLE
ncbi:hypothetical protein GI584_23440 [Gracilibacillus salitolerans]|uniref:Uncharacterized protein n=1 Tax=Gracilibacillus salitolerans TaxID=2663022 RepID=A0A5Q2TS18_9BACI|nr:hypothetical protein GI584_23440 [Gracilibacillus salitolerans]